MEWEGMIRFEEAAADLGRGDRDPDPLCKWLDPLMKKIKFLDLPLGGVDKL